MEALLLISYALGMFAIACIIGIAHRIRHLTQTLNFYKSCTVDNAKNALLHAQYSRGEFDKMGKVILNHKLAIESLIDSSPDVIRLKREHEVLH